MMYEVKYQGKWLSTNQAYGFNRWNRTKTKKVFRPFILNLVITPTPTIPKDTYIIRITPIANDDVVNENQY